MNPTPIRIARWKSLALILSSGGVLLSLSCVVRAVDVVSSGLAFAGSTGLFGPAGLIGVPAAAGVSFFADIVRLIR